MIPKSCPGHKTGRIPALLPVNIFCFSIIGAKLKAEKHALWAALRSAACGGALRRCAAPSAAARRFAPPLRGATRPARCARRPFANTQKMPNLSSLGGLSAEGTLLPPRALTADAAATLAAVRLQLPLSGERLRRARLLVARHLQAGRLRLRCRVWRHTLPGSAR